MTRLDGATAAAGTGSIATPAAAAAWPAARATRLILGAPELAVCAVAGFGLGPMVLLLAGQFRLWAVVPAGLAGAAVAIGVCGLPCDVGTDGVRDHARREAAWTLVAGLLIVGWAVYNARYTAENVYATRDPATYNIAARWLMDHPTLHIPTQPDVFGSPPGGVYQGAGFSDDGPGQVYAQGNHLMPALAAVVGWAFGVQGMFRANVVLGALALVALFGLARRVIGAPLATLVTAAMAVSLPMIYVSRDMYSEPLMMIFLMGGIALLHRATRTGRTADHALAGFVAGCAALVRIDSYVALLAVVVSATVIVGLARDGDRRAAVGHGLALVVAGAVPTLIGWLDVTRLSSGYYHDQHHNISLELAAGAVMLVAGPLAARVLWLPSVRDRLGSERARSRVAYSAIGGLVAFFVLLLSRPLWKVGRMPTRNPVLETWQRLAGVPVDGTRTYDERTVLWLAQYLGWTTVLVAVVGYSVLIDRAVRRRDAALVGLLTLGLTMSALYLWTSQITPDQPWAMRRYVPVVLPILFVAAAAALRRLAVTRWGWVAAAILGAVIVVQPLRVTLPMRHVREQVPMYAQVQAICRAVGDRGAVVAVDQEALSGYSMTMRAYCGVPSGGLVGAGPAELRAMAWRVSAHGRTLYVLARDRAAMAHAVGAPPGEPFDRVIAQLTPNDINRAPTLPGTRPTDVYLGRADADGRIQPLPPSR